MRYNFCPHCGCRLEENFKYCPMCGAAVADEGYDGYVRVVEDRYRTYPERDYEYNNSRPQQSDLDRAKILFNEKDYIKALAILLDYKDSKDGDILYMIGYCYYVTNKSDPNCEKYLKLAADYGNTSAQAVLGEYYYTLAEEARITDFTKGYDPSLGMSREAYDDAKAKCEKYYNLALVYLSLAKSTK